MGRVVVEHSSRDILSSRTLMTARWRQRSAQQMLGTESLLPTDTDDNLETNCHTWYNQSHRRLHPTFLLISSGLLSSARFFFFYRITPCLRGGGVRSEPNWIIILRHPSPSPSPIQRKFISFSLARLIVLRSRSLYWRESLAFLFTLARADWGETEIGEMISLRHDIARSARLMDFEVLIFSQSLLTTQVTQF